MRDAAWLFGAVIVVYAAICFIGWLLPDGPKVKNEGDA